MGKKRIKLTKATIKHETSINDQPHLIVTFNVMIGHEKLGVVSKGQHIKAVKLGGKLRKFLEQC